MSADPLLQRDAIRYRDERDQLRGQVEQLTLAKAAVEGERDAADDFAATIRDQLAVADADGWASLVLDEIDYLRNTGATLAGENGALREQLDQLRDAARRLVASYDLMMAAGDQRVLVTAAGITGGAALDDLRKLTGPAS